MLFRKCNHDHPFYVIFDNFFGCPNGVWEKKATDKKYMVVNDEDIDLETDSLPEAEERYLELCDDGVTPKHPLGNLSKDLKPKRYKLNTIIDG